MPVVWHTYLNFVLVKLEFHVCVLSFLQVIALLCVLFAVILIFISVLTPYWLESDDSHLETNNFKNFHQGLWCFSVNNDPCNPLVDGSKFPWFMRFGKFVSNSSDF